MKTTGVVPITGGGTGQTTAAAAYVAISIGTNTNDNAAAGNVGEYIESYIVSGSGIAMSTGVTLNITSISLTAGDWEIFGWGGCVGVAGTTYTQFVAAWDTANNTIPENQRGAIFVPSTTINTAQIQMTLPLSRLSISSTTTCYLNVFATFAGSTMKGFGRISARRRR